MVRFWFDLIRPVLAAVEPEVIVEIGALKGHTTQNLLRFCAGKRHLHCIDPMPDFDVNKMVREHEGYFFFHEDLSLNVIPKLPRFDVALIDGDHNWYTVYNELSLISDLHGKNPSAFPLILFHDICWPYGRRDLYYRHSTIPEAYRHPFAQKGIVYGQSELADQGGLNSTLDNAVHEGGKRNGVKTAIEDFMADSSIEFCFYEVPVNFGVGILCSKKRLKGNKSLRQVLDLTFSAEGLMRLLRRLEEIRARDAILMQQFFRRAQWLETQLKEETGKAT